MDSIQSLARPTRRAGLGAEAVRDPDVLQRQRGLVEDVIGVHPAEGNLGRADQTKVGVLDGVDLRLGPARVESDPFEDRDPGEVGGCDRSKPGLDQRVERELLKRQVKQHGVVLEEVEPIPRDLAAGLEVDQIQGPADLDVVLGREVEGLRHSHPAQLLALFLGLADRGVRVGQVGDPPELLLDFRFDAAEVVVVLSDGLLERLPLGDQLGPLLGVLLLADRLGDLVLAAASRFDLVEQPLALAVECDDPIEVGQVLRRDVALDAVPSDRLDVGQNIFQVEHGEPAKKRETNRGPQRQEAARGGRTPSRVEHYSTRVVPSAMSPGNARRVPEWECDDLPTRSNWERRGKFGNLDRRADRRYASLPDRPRGIAGNPLSRTRRSLQNRAIGFVRLTSRIKAPYFLRLNSSFWWVRPEPRTG